MKEFEELAKPLVDFLNNNYDMYASIIITTDNAKIVRDELAIPVKKD